MYKISIQFIGKLNLMGRDGNYSGCMRQLNLFALYDKLHRILDHYALTNAHGHTDVFIYIFMDLYIIYLRANDLAKTRHRIWRGPHQKRPFHSALTGSYVRLELDYRRLNQHPDRDCKSAIKSDKIVSLMYIHELEPVFDTLIHLTNIREYVNTCISTIPTEPSVRTSNNCFISGSIPYVIMDSFPMQQAVCSSIIGQEIVGEVSNFPKFLIFDFFLVPIQFSRGPKKFEEQQVLLTFYLEIF